MKVVQVHPQNFLFHSWPTVRYTFLLSLCFLIPGLILFIVFLSLGRVYKDVFGKTHYQVRYKPIDVTSVVLTLSGLICLTIVQYYNLRLFGFRKNTLSVGLWAGLFASLSLLTAEILFLVLNFCADPEKHYNDYGKCTCKNNLIDIGGKCSCPAGTYRIGGSCLTGCRNNDDCSEGGKCVGGYCCPSPFIDCDNQCCPPSECRDGTCCGSPDRACKDEKTGIIQCCPPQETCVNHACVAVCGAPNNQFFCPEGETCLQVNGNHESLQAFQSSFPADQKSVIENDTLYTCAKPPSCGLQSTSVFLPPVVDNDKVTFYPCYRNGEWINLDETKVKPEDGSKLAPLQLNICVPKDVNASPETYQKCWQTIRDGTENNVYGCQEDATCELVNVLKLDYVHDKNASQRVNTAVKLESLKADDKGTFKGNYCGDGAVRLRSVAFSDQCQDIQDKGHATLQSGIFTNSRYVYFDDEVCNTYFDCTAEENKSNDNFFTSYTYNDRKTPFTPYTLPHSTIKANALVDYHQHCPSQDECTPVDPTIWPDSTQYCECPGELQALETKRTGTDQQWNYDTDLCTKNGYLVHQKKTDLTLICKDASSCRMRETTDNPVLKNFSDDQECQQYCQEVIFTNIWYTIRICKGAKYDACEEFLTIQIKFNVKDDYSELSIPVITQTDYYDLSFQKTDGSPLSFSSSRKPCDRCVKNVRIFYILSGQKLCPILDCSASPGTGDGPNDSQPNRELLKSDRFVFGSGTMGIPSALWYYLSCNFESDIQCATSRWGDCSSTSSALFEGMCDTPKSPDPSRLEKFYLRFV